MFLHLHLLAAVYDITDFDRTAAIDSFKIKPEVVNLYLWEGFTIRLKISIRNILIFPFNN